MLKSSEKIFDVAILLELVGKSFSCLPGSGLPMPNSTHLHKFTKSTDNNSPFTDTDHEETFCYCREGKHGEIIGCDSQTLYKWFHLSCLRLNSTLKCKIWFCPDCPKLPEFNKKMLTKLNIVPSYKWGNFLIVRFNLYDNHLTGKAGLAGHVVMHLRSGNVSKWRTKAWKVQRV